MALVYLVSQGPPHQPAPLLFFQLDVAFNLVVSCLGHLGKGFLYLEILRFLFPGSRHGRFILNLSRLLFLVFEVMIRI